MTQDMFLYATRNKLRFASSRGLLSVEQLWDVPLRSRDDCNLNAIAKSANDLVKSLNEENFVETKRTRAHMEAEMLLAIVKYVIDVKKSEEQKADIRAKNRADREQLLAILAEKQAGKLSELSERELKRRIADCSAEIDDAS